jgi:hypothetical protein
VGRGEETGFQIEQRNWQKEMEPCSAVLTRKASYKEGAGLGHPVQPALWGFGRRRRFSVSLAKQATLVRMITGTCFKAGPPSRQ